MEQKQRGLKKKNNKKSIFIPLEQCFCCKVTKKSHKGKREMTGAENRLGGTGRYTGLTVMLALRCNKPKLIVFMKSLCSLRKRLLLIRRAEFKFAWTWKTLFTSCRRSDLTAAELTPLNPSWTFGGKCQQLCNMIYLSNQKITEWDAVTATPFSPFNPEEETKVCLLSVFVY